MILSKLTAAGLGLAASLAITSGVVPSDVETHIDDEWACVPDYDIEYGDIHADYDGPELLINVTYLDWQHVHQGLDECGEAHTWTNN